MAISSSQILSEIPLAYQQTAAEIAAGVTPVTYAYPPGNVFRYCTGTQISNIQTNTGTADVSGPIQNAINSTTGDVFFPTGFYYIGKPLYITSVSTQNLRFVGESRTNTYIQPNAASIADSNGINALIINQKANSKFQMLHIRLSSQVAAYTGICISAVNNGPASQQAIFSGGLQDCWFDTGSTNGGFFSGFLSNFYIDNCTWEFQKGCFNFPATGGGASNVQFTDCTLSNCYDYFIQSNNTKNNEISVNSLQVYTHNRGVLFSLNGDTSVTLHDIQLQASTGAANLGGIGLFSLTNCYQFSADAFKCYANATFGTGAIATAISLTGSNAQFTDGNVDGANIGILVTGAGSNAVTFDNVNCVNNGQFAFNVTNTGGTPGGWIKAANCNWSDCQDACIWFTNAGAFDFFLEDCRLMNSGLGGATGFRNVAVSTSGTFIARNCIIGQNNGSAVAAYYVDCSGSGFASLIDPIFIGAPPSGLQNPSAVQLVAIDGEETVAYSASITFSAANSKVFNITANNSTAFTINAPTSPMYGKRITVKIINSSGGALGAITWPANFKMSAWTSPANGFSRSIDLDFNGSNWVQVAQTGVDVPN